MKTWRHGTLGNKQALLSRAWCPPGLYGQTGAKQCPHSTLSDPQVAEWGVENQVCLVPKQMPLLPHGAPYTSASLFCS